MVRENTKLIVAFVVPVLIIAGVVGYQMYREEEVPIEVDEGFAEMTVTVPPYPEMESYNQTTTATTYINGKNNTLELTVHPMRWTIGFADIRISVESVLEPELEPTDLIIMVRTVEAPDVQRCGQYVRPPIPDGDISNLSLWPTHENRHTSMGDRESFIGFNINGNEFYFQNLKYSVEYPLIDEHDGLESPITVEITAVLRGLSEDVKATIRVSYIPMGGRTPLRG